MLTSVHCTSSTMKLRGSLLVIVCCLVVELGNFNLKEYLLMGSDLRDRVLILTGLGLMFLLYPLVGHLTDVYLTRYRSLNCPNPVGINTLSRNLSQSSKGYYLCSS